MKRKRVISLLLALACAVSLVTSCSGGKTSSGAASGVSSAAESSTASQGSTVSPSATSGTEHEALTMTAMVPFRNPTHLANQVHEKYPEINIEFVPYSGYNGTAYTKMQLEADDMPDIYLGSMYTPSVTDVSDRLIDLSAYPFTDNFTDQRLREVTDNGSIYLLPLYYSCLAITYNKMLLEKNGWELPNSLEDALHVMEVLCTVDGMISLSVNENSVDNILVPLKDYVISDNSYYKPIEEALNEGYVAPYVYSGWEDIVLPVGEKMFSFMKGECDIEDVAKAFDENQYLLDDNSDNVFTTVTETLSIEDCVKLVGMVFSKASGADVALVSTNKWYATDQDIAMDTRGVQSPLYAMPITDEELTAMLPTGWTGTIQTVTLTGARINELLENGYDKFEDGIHVFPYTLVTPDGFNLEDDKTYTVAICGASSAVQEEGDIQDTGIVGLTAMEDYLSQYETYTPADINWD